MERASSFRGSRTIGNYDAFLSLSLSFFFFFLFTSTFEILQLAGK